MMRATILRVLAVLLGLSQLCAVAAAQAVAPLDFPLPNGHFYSQANGMGGAGGTGFAIVDAFESPGPFGVTSIPFFTTFQQHGGVQSLGFPASQLTIFPDFPIQVCQKLVLQDQ